MAVLPSPRPEMHMVEVHAAAALSSGFIGTLAAAATAMQLVLTPENIWVPLSVTLAFVGGFFGIAVYSTVRVIRFIDKITRNQQKLLKHVGIDDAE